MQDNNPNKPASKADEAIASTKPANWTRFALMGLVAVVLVLLVVQMMSGGAGTQVQPGTPVSAPSATAPVTTTPAADAPKP